MLSIWPALICLSAFCYCQTQTPPRPNPPLEYHYSPDTGGYFTVNDSTYFIDGTYHYKDGRSDLSYVIPLHELAGTAVAFFPAEVGTYTHWLVRYSIIASDKSDVQVATGMVKVVPGRGGRGGSGQFNCRLYEWVAAEGGWVEFYGKKRSDHIAVSGGTLTYSLNCKPYDRKAATLDVNAISSLSQGHLSAWVNVEQLNY